jgi:import receptor subunit TOM7
MKAGPKSLYCTKRRRSESLEDGKIIKSKSERGFPNTPCWLTVTTMPSEETKVRPQRSFWYNLLKIVQERVIRAIDFGRVCSSLFHTPAQCRSTNSVQTVLHYSWIPFIIYVGYTRSNPQPSLIKCVCQSSLSLRMSNWTG